MRKFGYLVVAGLVVSLVACGALSPDQAAELMAEVDAQEASGVITAERAGALREIIDSMARGLTAADGQAWIATGVGLVSVLLGGGGLFAGMNARKQLKARGPAKPMDPALVEQLKAMAAERAQA